MIVEVPPSETSSLGGLDDPLVVDATAVFFEDDTTPKEFVGGLDIASEDTSAGASGSGDPPPPPPPPIEAHGGGDEPEAPSGGCDALLILENGATIRHYRYGRLEIHCPLACQHGKACRRTFSTNAPKGGWRTRNPSQGRCLGAAVAPLRHRSRRASVIAIGLALGTSARQPARR